MFPKAFNISSSGGIAEIDANIVGDRLIVRPNGISEGATVIEMSSPIDEPPEMIIEPCCINFDNVIRGSTLQTKELTIRNEGTGNLVISDLYILDTEKSGVFSLGSLSLPLTIPPNQEKKIPVNFDPAADKNNSSYFSANIYVQSNDPNESSGGIAEIDANIVGDGLIVR